MCIAGYEYANNFLRRIKKTRRSTRTRISVNLFKKNGDDLKTFKTPLLAGSIYIRTGSCIIRHCVTFLDEESYHPPF